VARPLADLAWPDVAQVKSGVVLAVPVGATEQHGPPLPLSTDTAEAMGAWGTLE
jgi:creatinine amidohydrolase